jgi:hypothetical protein
MVKSKEGSATTENEEVENFPISEQSAEAQFRVFLRYYDVSFGDIEITDGEKAALTMKNFLVRSIRRGRLQFELVEQKLQITHVLDMPTENTKQIVYKDKVATARVAVNKADESADGTMEFMSAMSGVPVSEFMKLHGADNTTYSRLSAVFSMV